MATVLDRDQIAARAAAAGIARNEAPEADYYYATKAQLIAAGMLMQEQFPPPRRDWITFMDGELLVSKGSYRMNERHVRVQRWVERDTYRLWVGVSNVVRARRLKEEKDRFAAQRAAAARARQKEEVAAARDSLAMVPRTADEFRREMVRDVRDWMHHFMVRKPELRGHGYALAPDSLHAVLMGVDTVVEAIMEADVALDYPLHLAKVNGLQATIAAGDIATSAKLAQLTSPNFDLLSSEVQP